jgi:hypothetical protein
MEDYPVIVLASFAATMVQFFCHTELELDDYANTGFCDYEYHPEYYF